MTKHVYFVVMYRGKWAVSFQGKRSAPFQNQRDAVRSAVDRAYKAGKEGHDAQVVLQRLGQYRTEWTYGKDAYPPA